MQTRLTEVQAHNTEVHSKLVKTRSAHQKAAEEVVVLRAKLDTAAEAADSSHREATSLRDELAKAREEVAETAQERAEASGLHKALRSAESEIQNLRAGELSAVTRGRVCRYNVSC